MKEESDLTDDKLDLRGRMRQMRLQREADCQEMARELGLEENAYLEMEEGKREIPLETILQAASFFQVTVDVLIYGRETASTESGEDKEILTLLESSAPEQRKMAFKLMQVYLEE